MWGHLQGIRDEITLIRAYGDIIRYLAVPKSSFFGDGECYHLIIFLFTIFRETRDNFSHFVIENFFQFI